MLTSCIFYCWLDKEASHMLQTLCSLLLEFK